MESLVDKNTINLLKACALLPRPTAAQIDEKAITLGPKTRQKLLILDMDETLIHSKFSPIKDPAEVSKILPGLRMDEKGCMEFNILIS